MILTLSAIGHIIKSPLAIGTCACYLEILGVGLYDYIGHARVDLGHVTTPIT